MDAKRDVTVHVQIFDHALAGIWHRFTYGQAEFFMLDVRSQRDPATDPDGPGKSMLNGGGIPNGQKQWFLDGLAGSAATWKFVVCGVTFNPACKEGEGWGAYATERQEVLDFIAQNEITGVIFITGDAHSGGAIDDVVVLVSVMSLNPAEHDCTGGDGFAVLRAAVC